MGNVKSVAKVKLFVAMLSPNVDLFEKVKPYMRDFRRKDFLDGIIKVTGRPEGYRCLEKDVSKVEEILGIENTLEKRQNKILRFDFKCHRRIRQSNRTI